MCSCLLRLLVLLVYLYYYLVYVYACCPVQVLCKKVSDSYLWSLVTFLLEGLVDYQAHSSSGACVVLNNMVKLRGSVLSEQVPVVMCTCV